MSEFSNISYIFDNIKREISYSKLLASQLNARKAARQIEAIRDKTGALTTNYKENNSVFKQF